MKSILEFLKTSLLGGLFVLLPLLLFYLLFTELLQLVVALATPIADLFPKGTFDEVKTPVVFAVILIVGASFILGLALRSMLLRRAGLWIEGTTLGRLPIYNAVKNLSKGLAGARDDTAFNPAVFNSAEGQREIVYVIEDHGDGNLTVLAPWAPASFSGQVKILASDRIQMLDATLDEVSRALSFWGLGTRHLLGRVINGGADKPNGSS